MYKAKNNYSLQHWCLVEKVFNVISKQKHLKVTYNKPNGLNINLFVDTYINRFQIYNFTERPNYG